MAEHRGNLAIIDEEERNASRVEDEQSARLCVIGVLVIILGMFDCVAGVILLYGSILNFSLQTLSVAL